MLYFHKVCITEVKNSKEEKQQNNTTMSSKERKEKLEAQLSEVRQKAVEVEAALKHEQERKEFAQMVAQERARQDAKKRTFANPQTADEAEGDLPTLEQLANGGILLRSNSGKWKTREEILEDGTLLEKLRLYFSSGDMDGYFGTEGKLTKQEIAKIAASIRTKEDKEVVEICYKEYHALREYGKQLQYFFKRFQVSYSMLAVLLNKWDSYEQRAAEYTQEYNSLGTRTIEINVTETKATQIPNEILQGALTKYVEKLNSRGSFDGATLYFDEATTSFKVKVDGKGGLYSQIKQEEKAAIEALADFKAFVLAVEKYLEASVLHFMPISIQMSVENAEEERYTRYLVKNLSYFRSELNSRKEQGETITPEEEKRAVIPDYYEVEPTKEVYKSCIVLLKQLS